MSEGCSGLMKIAGGERGLLSFVELVSINEGLSGLLRVRMFASITGQHPPTMRNNPRCPQFRPMGAG